MFEHFSFLFSFFLLVDVLFFVFFQFFCFGFGCWVLGFEFLVFI